MVKREWECVKCGRKPSGDDFGDPYHRYFTCWTCEPRLLKTTFGLGDMVRNVSTGWLGTVVETDTIPELRYRAVFYGIDWENSKHQGENNGYPEWALEKVL